MPSLFQTSYEWNFIILGILVIMAIGFAVMPLIIARVIAPRKPSLSKQDIYECGLESKGEAWGQFRIQYYVYALMFVIFAVETVFLYPWAVASKKLGIFALVEMGIFLVILGIGLVYAWRKGVLEWK
ncbi:MAG: NADH-quinone oxidoreductase subunit A [Verrucomicrobiota bacterium]|nr:NADH-quinone oxidoreductase subunit A [Verrucomicrobiota bacterium]